MECLVPIKQQFLSNPDLRDRYCSCPRACDTSLYLSTLTSQPLSDLSRQAIVATILAANNCSDPASSTASANQFCNASYTNDMVQGSFVQLEVWFSTLMSEEITVEPAYTVLALLCDVGGALGLILGSTILTLVEFLDFFIISAVQGCLLHSAVRQNKVAQKQGENRVYTDKQGHVSHNDIPPALVTQDTQGPFVSESNHMGPEL